MERQALGPGSMLPVGLVGRAEATCFPDLPDGAPPVGCPPPWSSARTGGLLSGEGGSALGIPTPASVQAQGQAGWCWYNQGSALEPQTDRALGPLWPEDLSPPAGTLQLEPHWAERAGPPRGAEAPPARPAAPLLPQCKKKHTLLCPDFSRRGACPRGAQCQLLHRGPRRPGRRAATPTAPEPSSTPPRSRASTSHGPR